MNFFCDFKLMAGKVAAVDLLLKNGANISRADITKLLPVFDINEDMIKCLISNGVDLSAVNNERGFTLLHIAVMQGKCARQLIKYAGFEVCPQTFLYFEFLEKNRKFYSSTNV